MKVMIALAAVVLSSAIPANAQPAPPVGPDWSKVVVKTTDLGHRTYMLEGQGGNITIAVAEDGIIMVDGQFAPMHDKLKAAIEAVSQQPIKYLINTHHHGDHTGGNGPFTKDGAVVVAHDNVRKHLAEGSVANTTGIKVPPVPAEALPVKTYADATGPVIELKGRSAALKHPANAHTDGDTYIYFADANVLSTGDTFTNGRYPNIDTVNGGSIKGMISACDAYLALANDDTKIVPGHGPLATKAQLAQFRAMLAVARERMTKLIAEGKSEADVKAAKPFADFDATLALNEQAGQNFIHVVYLSVKGP